MKNVKWFGLSVLFICLSFLLAGCAGNPVKTANEARDGIHSKTDEIVTAATNATASINKADAKVTAATTQPGNPATTVTLLQGAHTDLGKAKDNIATIAPATKVIDDKANTAAKITEEVVAEKEKIANGWGARLQRLVHGIFWTLVFVIPIIAIVCFIVKTNGGGPILDAVGQVAGDLLRGLWKGIKWLSKVVLHLVTLGSLKFAEITNKHYDKREAAKKV